MNKIIVNYIKYSYLYLSLIPLLISIIVFSSFFSEDKANKVDDYIILSGLMLILLFVFGVFLRYFIRSFYQLKFVHAGLLIIYPLKKEVKRIAYRQMKRIDISYYKDIDAFPRYTYFNISIKTLKGEKFKFEFLKTKMLSHDYFVGLHNDLKRICEPDGVDISYKEDISVLLSLK